MIGMQTPENPFQKLLYLAQANGFTGFRLTKSGHLETTWQDRAKVPEEILREYDSWIPSVVDFSVIGGRLGAAAADLVMQKIEALPPDDVEIVAGAVVQMGEGEMTGEQLSEILARTTGLNADCIKLLDPRAFMPRLAAFYEEHTKPDEEH